MIDLENEADLVGNAKRGRKKHATGFLLMVNYPLKQIQ